MSPPHRKIARLPAGNTEGPTGSRTIGPRPGRRPFVCSGAFARNVARIRSLATQSQTGFHQSGTRGTGIDPDEEDHYSLLGVPFTASHADITRAYRRAIKRAHPDRQRPDRRGHFEELARQLNAAYAVLSDPLKRQAYDRTIRQQVIQDQIMQRYVGGFETFDRSPGPADVPRRPQPSAAERRERVEADRRASLTLVMYAAGVTAIILLVLLFGSIVGSILHAVR